MEQQKYTFNYLIFKYFRKPKIVKEYKNWAAGVTQQGKGLAAKADDQSSVPRT